MDDAVLKSKLVGFEEDLKAEGYEVMQDWEQLQNEVWGLLIQKKDEGQEPVMSAFFYDADNDRTLKRVLGSGKSRGPTPGTRVHVLSGDQERDLGNGTYVGEVAVQVCVMPDGSLRSMHDAEKGFDPADVPVGATVKNIGKNPKIELDSGDIVYGCQVWWEPIKEGE